MFVLDFDLKAKTGICYYIIFYYMLCYNFLCILEVVELAVMVGGRGRYNPYIISSRYEGEGEAKI